MTKRVQRRISRFSFAGETQRSRFQDPTAQRDPKSDHTTLVPLERLLAAPFVARASLPQTREARPFPTTASEHQRARLVSPRVQPRASPRRSSLERVASPAGSLADRVTSQTNARRWAEVAKRPRPPARPRCVSDLPRTPLRAALVAVSRSAPPHGSSRGRDDRRRRARPRRSRGDVTSRARVFFFQSRSNAFREPFADRRRPPFRETL